MGQIFYEEHMFVLNNALPNQLQATWFIT